MGRERVAPRTTIGGQAEFEERIERAMAVLGHIIGMCCFALVIVVLAIELLLNPLFLFAQSNQNGVSFDNVLLSLGWWSVTLIGFACSGIQYALFDENSRKGSIGVKIAWIIAILDTFMDGGGVAAWMECVARGDATSTDSSQLSFGIFPSFDSPWWVWPIYGTICATCLLHEKFLEIVFGREEFEPASDASEMTRNICFWIHRSGKLFSGFRYVAISLAPYILLMLDMLLFVQSVRGEHEVVTGGFCFVSFIVTILTIATWEYYAHLRERGYRIFGLNLTHQAIFAFVICVTVGDSLGDLSGFNNLIFGQSTLWPPELEQVVPFILTAGLTILMTSTFELMFHDMFAQLGRRLVPGKSSGSGGPASIGGDDGGDSPLLGGF